MKSALLRTLAITISADNPLVERNAPGEAPTAFRIWAAGANEIDGGTIYFTPKSAAALMAEQDARGRLYAFDFDHLSLLPDRPAESGRAAGWHRLAVRDGDGGPELWAVENDWCADAKAGLEAQPPLWRYFSPAFRTKDGEVTSYINCALCINPLTHQLPSLASESAAKEPTMKEKMLAALATLANAEASDEEKKAAAKLLGDYLESGGEEPPKKKPEGETTAEEPPPAKKPEGETTAEEPPKKPEGEKTETTSAVAKIERRLAEYDGLVKRVAAQDAAERTKLLAARPDLTDGMRKELASKPLEEVTRLLSFMPGPSAQVNTRTTQGEGDVDGNGASGGLQGAELAEYNKLAGKRAPITKSHERREDGSLQMNAIAPSDWNRLHPLTKKDGK